MADDAALKELNKYKGYLRATEDEVAELRAEVATLKQENWALRIALRNANASKTFSGRPLAPENEATPEHGVWMSGVTGARFVRVEDVDTGGML